MEYEEPIVKRQISKQDTKWNCINCTFENSAYLTVCELCGKDSPIDNLQTCYFCGSKNKMESKQCTICNSQLNKPIPKKVTIIYCPECLFENDEQYNQCLSCGAYLKGEAIQKPQNKICHICAMQLVHTLNPKQHMKACEESLSMIQKIRIQQQNSKIIPTIPQLKVKPIMPKPFCLKPHPPSKPHPIKPEVPIHKVCSNCLGSFPANTYDSHILNCKAKQIDLSKIVKVKSQPMILTPLQKQAISFMQSTSKDKHMKARSQLQSKIKKMGFKQNDLQALEHYVQNYAPIIVHVHVSKHMQFFVKDTHYRNQFETGKSSGSLSRDSRTQWQNRMFSNKYSSAKDFQRVKYGTINFTNDPAGVSACKSYGNSYFLLKEDVRERCTFTDMDSSNTNSLIGTFKYGDHILSKLSDAELKAAINAAKANQVSSSVITTYKQIQIHGPLQFSRDIQRLYVNKIELTSPVFKQLVQQFSAKFGVDYQIF